MVIPTTQLRRKHQVYEHPRLPPLFRLLNLTLDVSLLRRPESTVLARIRVSRPRGSGHRNTALLGPEVDGLGVLFGLRVDTYINGRIKPVFDLCSDQRDLHDGVVAALLAHVEKEVVSVLGLDLLVGVVGGHGFDARKEILLDVELAYMRDGAALDGVVGEEFGAVVDNSCS